MLIKIWYSDLSKKHNTISITLFRFAWLALGTPFYFIEHPVASCGYFNTDNVFCGQTMVQHLPNGQFGFLHRNLLKWDITKPLSTKVLVDFCRNIGWLSSQPGQATKQEIGNKNAYKIILHQTWLNTFHSPGIRHSLCW